MIKSTDANSKLGELEKDGATYSIRKLTPLECWRLMGFSDEDFHKAEVVNSNTQLYKQAGNSIVKDVLMAIFGQMMDCEKQPVVESKEDIKKRMLFILRGGMF